MTHRTNAIFGIGGVLLAVTLIASSTARPLPLPALAPGDTVRAGALEMTALVAHGSHGGYVTEVLVSNASPIEMVEVRAREFRAETDRGESLANLSPVQTVRLDPGETVRVPLVFAGRPAKFVRVSLPRVSGQNALLKKGARPILLPVAEADVAEALCRTESNCVP